MGKGGGDGGDGGEGVCDFYLVVRGRKKGRNDEGREGGK